MPKTTAQTRKVIKSPDGVIHVPVIDTPGPASECSAHGIIGPSNPPGQTIYVHAVWGPAWDAIGTAVDRSCLIAAAPGLLKEAKRVVAAIKTAVAEIPRGTPINMPTALELESSVVTLESEIAKAEGRE